VRAFLWWWCGITAGVFIVWALLFISIESVAMPTFDLLESWKQIFLKMTPESSQDKGNILLGVFCAMSGIFVYSAIVGAVTAILGLIARKLLLPRIGTRKIGSADLKK
jgi:hypothetical protein